MAVDRRSERSALRGLIVPDQTLVFDESQSTLTQAGPRAGVPEPSRPTPLVLSTTGTQAASSSYSVEVVQGGAPGVLDQSVGVTWTEGSGRETGWDLPGSIHGWTPPYWTDSSVAAYPPHVVTVGGDIVVVFPVGASVFSRVLDQTTGTWGSLTLVANGNPSGNLTKNACLLPLPSGRLLCFYWRTSVSSFTSYPVDVQIGMSYSDDGGTTWTLGSKAVLPEALTHATTGPGVTRFSTLGRLRACYSQGDICLIASVRLADTALGAGNSRDGFIQYASSDEGHRFIEVSRADFAGGDDHSGSYYEPVTLPDGRIFVGWIGVTSSVCPARKAILGGAYSSLLTATDDRIQIFVGNGELGLEADSTKYVAIGDIAAVVSDDGQIFVYLYNADDIFQLAVFRSQDGGDTFQSIGRTDGLEVGHVYDSADNSNYLTNFSAAWWQGRVALAHQWSSVSAAEAGVCVGLALLGGWSDVNLPLLDGYTDSEHRAGWTRTWLPTDEPDDLGWTAAGAGTVDLAVGGLSISTTTLQSKTYAKLVGLGEEGVFFRAALTVVSGGNLTKGVHVGIWDADGSDEYFAEVWISTTSIRLIDVADSNAEEASATIDTTGGIELMGSVVGTSVRAFYRAASPTGCRAWSRLSGSLTVNSSTARSSPGIAFGHGTQAADSKWTEVHYSYGDQTGKIQGTSGLDFHAVPKPISSLPTYLDQGLYLRATQGPGWAEDSWTITPRYDYGIAKVEPVQTPSPRAGWRSTTDADDVYLAFSSGGDGDEHQWGGQLVAFAFFNVNWSIGAIQTRSTAGTWSTLLDFDSADPGLTQIAYARNGATLTPTSSTGSNPFLRLNELAGSSIYLASGKVCRIVSNTAGRWSTATGAQRPTITIDASSLGVSDALSGNASVVPKDFAVVTRVPTTAIEGVRVYIEGQDTFEGYFQIGTAVLGHVEVFGDEYSWGRTVDLEPSVERTQLRGGTTRTRVLAPPRRRISFGWAEGVDVSDVEGLEPEPDYLTSSSTASSPAVASIGSTPWQAYGLISLLDSGRVPVVYLPSIPLGSTGNDTNVLNRREQLSLVQVVSPVSLETIQGDEGQDEVLRVANVELEEVL